VVKRKERSKLKSRSFDGGRSVGDCFSTTVQPFQCGLYPDPIAIEGTKAHLFCFPQSLFHHDSLTTLPQLGIPTANIPPTGLSAYPTLQTGVYFGFVGLRLDPSTTQPADNSNLTLSSSATTTSNPLPSTSSPPEKPTTSIFPAVLSIGYNPYYANKERSIEIHILHQFTGYNFYDAPLNLLILGFIRPEYDYESLEALVEDIRGDCEVAGRSLGRSGYRVFAEEGGEGKGKGEGGWLRGFEWVDEEEKEKGGEEKL
jgi:riboflavin kinase